MILEGGRWLVFLSFFLAMTVSVMQLPSFLPDWLVYLDPDWVVMVLFFWVIQMPERVGLIVAWFIGFPMDVMLGEPIGLNGACYVGVTFFGWSLYERIRMFSSIQQGAVLFGLLFVVGLVKITVVHFIQGLEWSLIFLGSATITVLLWFPVSRILQILTLRFVDE